MDEEMEAREHQHQPARHSLQQELLDRHSRADASALLNSNISSCIRPSAAFAGKINRVMYGRQPTFLTHFTSITVTSTLCIKSHAKSYLNMTFCSKFYRNSVIMHIVLKRDEYVLSRCLIAVENDFARKRGRGNQRNGVA